MGRPHIGVVVFFFNKSRVKQDLQKQILGIINRTDASLPRVDERRAGKRFLRAVPVVLAPWNKSGPSSEVHAFAVTRDISVSGMGLILQQPFKAEEVLIGIRPTPIDNHEPLQPPQFFVGSINANTAIGGGYWLLSVELVESVTPDHSREFGQFQEFATRLTPPVIDERLLASQSLLN